MKLFGMAAAVSAACSEQRATRFSCGCGIWQGFGARCSVRRSRDGLMWLVLQCNPLP